MTVAAICSRDIVCVSHDASLAHAARLMREHQVGAVVVNDARGDGTHIVGLVTDRDLVIEALARSLDAASVPVGALLSGAPLLSVPEQAELGEAIRRMRSGSVRRLLVHDDERCLVGLLSFDDLMCACGAQVAGLAAVLAQGGAREAAWGGPLFADEAAPTSAGASGAQPTSPAVAAVAAASPRRLRVPAMGIAGWPTGAECTP